MIEIVVTCFHCGRKVVLMSKESIKLGCEFMSAVEWAGMKSYHDVRYHRILAFCNDECAKEEKTKIGWFRKRPKGVK